MAKIVVRELIDAAKKRNASGLAANQLGFDIRVAVVRIGARKYQSLINPQVIASMGHEQGPEECLSIPGLVVRVPRATHVVLRTSDGKQHRFQGPIARAVQHELEHLNGVLLTDHVTI